MLSKTSQTDNTVSDGDIVAGNKVTNNFSETTNKFSKKTKLSSLFEKLKEEFDQNKRLDAIGDNLRKFSEPRDTIGLEQKLINGSREHVVDDALWLKQEYVKKLTKFQFFEPAQEIHAFLLSVVFEKFRNLIYPMLRANQSELEVSKVISDQIVSPILEKIHEEGCDDIMGLSSSDVEGMIYYLTGQCHIKWVNA